MLVLEVEEEVGEERRVGEAVGEFCHGLLRNVVWFKNGSDVAADGAGVNFDGGASGGLQRSV